MMERDETRRFNPWRWKCNFSDCPYSGSVDTQEAAGKEVARHVSMKHSNEHTAMCDAWADVNGSGCTCHVEGA